VNFDEIVKRVEGLLTALELAVEDAADFRDKLKALVEERISALETTAETVREIFPEKLRANLSFSEKDDYVIVNVQRRLKPEAFKAVVDIAIGKLAGEYVSLGGSGYFRILKKACRQAARS
jgi:ribosomal protein L17